MKKTAEAGDTVRIVNFGSNAHPSAPKNTKFESLDELNHDNGPTAQYGRSKLAAMLYARWLATHVTSQHQYVRPLSTLSFPNFLKESSRCYCNGEALDDFSILYAL